MTFICASIAILDVAERESALNRAIDAASQGADLIEWRLDAIADEPGGLEVARDLVKRSPRPCIVTCRPTWEGGEYDGDESTRVSLFEALGAGERDGAADRPRYVDLELAAYRRSANLRQKALLAIDHPRQPRDMATGLILSAHDFDGRPADLLQRVEAMTRDEACSVMKAAWLARSLRDNLEAFELLSHRRKPMIALCMGRFGLMSRVLAPKFGGFLTFATDREQEVTAPGQPTISDLKKTYRFDSIGRGTKVYGVIGWPAEQSKGPLIHNAGFGAVGHDGVHLPMPVPPEYEHFKATVGAMIDFGPLDFRGASVTSPHKENLVRFVVERGGRVDATAARLGAANTLVVGSAGGMECLNTDAAACVEALGAGMGVDRAALASKRIAVLGAGGMARAAAAGLVEAGARVVVFNPTIERARRLVDDLTRAGNSESRLSVGKTEELACGCFHAFINCTTIGMTGGPAPDESPLPDDVPLDDSMTVFDTVYSPELTPLIKEAASRGARAVTGRGLFLRQAAMQFERWTGKTAPMGAFEEALKA